MSVRLRGRMHLYLNTVPVCVYVWSRMRVFAFLCPRKPPRPVASSCKARQLSPGRRRHAPLNGINEASTAAQVDRDSISSGHVYPPCLPLWSLEWGACGMQARGVRKRTAGWRVNGVARLCQFRHALHRSLLRFERRGLEC